jgi:hypothetical protein
MNQIESPKITDLNKLLNENKIMRQLARRQGFFDYYFTECKNHKSNHAAFDAVNDLYFELFGEYRYSDYAAFKNVNNYYNKKK